MVVGIFDSFINKFFMGKHCILHHFTYRKDSYFITIYNLFPFSIFYFT